MSKTLTRTVLITSASLAATAAAVRAALDLPSADGGIVTMRITNGGTGPGAQCYGRVLIAHKQTTMPAPAAEGTGDGDWKQVYEFGGGTAASASARRSYRFGPEVAHIEVEFVGNTGQAVTIEAIVTTYAY